jgi:hypothetical protein
MEIVKIRRRNSPADMNVHVPIDMQAMFTGVKHCTVTATPKGIVFKPIVEDEAEPVTKQVAATSNRDQPPTRCPDE